MEAADVARASLLGRHEVIDGLALLQPLQDRPQTTTNQGVFPIF